MIKPRPVRGFSWCVSNGFIVPCSARARENGGMAFDDTRPINSIRCNIRRVSTPGLRLLGGDCRDPGCGPRANTGVVREDLRCFELYLSATAQTPLEQHEFDALVSLLFDVGILAFERSPLRALVNAGDKLAAADALRHWPTPEDDAARIARRRDEAEWFLYGSLAVSSE